MTMPELCRIYAKARLRAQGHREVWKSRKAGTYPYLDMIIQRIFTYKADGEDWVVHLDDENTLRSPHLTDLKKAVEIICRGQGWTPNYKEAHALLRQS